MINKKFYVYGLFNPSNKKPFYIGKGSGNRLNQHLKNYNLDPKTADNSHKVRKILKLKRKNKKPYAKKIVKNLLEKEAYKKEKKIIKKIGIENLTNIIPGGHGPKSGKDHPKFGTSMPEKAKEKISKANSGKNNGMYGVTGKDHPSYGTTRNLSEETKQKMSETLTGTSLSKEAKEKISKANSGENHGLYGVTGKDHPSFGRTHSKKTKEKISKANSGENNPNYNKTPSKKTRKKISETLKGHDVSPKTRKKISEANKNKSVSKKVKKQISESMKGENHHDTNLTKNEVKEIKWLIENTKMKQKNIGKKYGNLDQTTISSIKHNRNWKDVTKTKKPKWYS